MNTAPIAPFSLKSDEPLTHKAAVKRMAAWLKGAGRCLIVAAELKTQNHETPDVLGFYGAGGSILIECKVSRSDFLADRNKIFRAYQADGMGDLRYFAAPMGLLRADEMPENWGLLEIGEHRIRKTLEANYQQANKTAEVKMLMSIIRRLEIATAVFVQHEGPIERIMSNGVAGSDFGVAGCHDTPAESAPCTTTASPTDSPPPP